LVDGGGLRGFGDVRGGFVEQAVETQDVVAGPGAGAVEVVELKEGVGVEGLDVVLLYKLDSV
jgi:hypothetical protein